MHQSQQPTPNEPADPVSIWIVEDQDLVRTTTAFLLNGQADLSCPLAVATCEEALEQIESRPAPDMVLLDIGLPGMDGIEGARRFSRRAPDTRVIMLTVHDERETVFEAIAAGASGYLLKSAPPEELLTAVRQVAAGGAPMNPFIARKILDLLVERREPSPDYGLTEREILELMVGGLKMRTIADRLCISYHTVDGHIRNIYAKLHVSTRSRAVAKALRENLID